MTCPGCGRYAPPDPTTGYDADEFCPECEEQNEKDLADDPNADDESLKESLEQLSATIDWLCAEHDHIRDILRAFYMAPISASSLQPVLDLCEQLDPTLRSQRLAQRIEDTVLSLVPTDEDDDILTPAKSPF